MDNLIEEIRFSTIDKNELSGSYYRASSASCHVIILHGLQGHSGWFRMGDLLAQNGINVLAFDRRGSGKSAGVKGHVNSYRDFYLDIDAAISYCEQLDPNKPIHIIATSFGSLIAFSYQLFHPGKISSISLLTPVLYTLNNNQYSFTDKLKILFGSSDNYFPTVTKLEDYTSSIPNLEWLKKDPLVCAKVTAQFLKATLKLRKYARKAVNEINIPMFLLLAKQDLLVDNSKAVEKLYDPYKGSKNLKFYDSKHVLEFSDYMEEIALELSGWIKLQVSVG